MVDLAALIIQVFVVQVLRVIIGKCWKSSLTKPAFDVPQSGLAMIYSQAICWLGIYFCPLIPVVTAIKTFLAFYIQKFYISKICSIPDKVPYTASRAAAIFNCLLLMSFTICSGFVVYSVAEIGPSSSCGPFRNVHCKNGKVYVYVQDFFQGKQLTKFLTILGLETFQYGLFFILVLWLYILASNNFAQSGLMVEQKKDWQSLKQTNAEKWDNLASAVRRAFGAITHSSRNRPTDRDQDVVTNVDESSPLNAAQYTR